MFDVMLSPFQWANLVLLGLLLFSIVAWVALNVQASRRVGRTGEASGIADVSWGGHLSRFLVAFTAIAALAGLALLQTGWLFDSFSTSKALGAKLLDNQSFVGLLGVWIGAPVAFASALYAIYMAHAALQLAKGQNRISESQLELDRTINDPDRPVFVDGINSLLDLDSAAMALVSLGQLQLRERSGAASERDALRAQLAAVLGAINSQAILRFVNRLPERREILERIMALRFALFRANEVGQGMPLRADYPDQQYLAWSAKRGEWASEMAAAMSLVLRESIHVVASVRRACRRFPSLASLPDLQAAASGASLAEAAAFDQLVDGRLHIPSKVAPSRGVVELLDDGRSEERLLTLLASGLVEVPSPTDPGVSTQVELREWEEGVRDFRVGVGQYTVFRGFREFWRVLYNEARRGNDGQLAGLGEGLVIIIDTPYGAERESPEVKAKRDVETSLKATEASATRLTGADYREPARIWEIARQLSRLPAKMELMKRLLASSQAVRLSAGVSTQVEADDGIQDWNDVEQLIDLQDRLARTPIEHLQQLAEESYDLGDLKPDRLVWICLNSESERQRDGAGEWWFRMFGDARYLWLNEPGEGELHRFESRRG